MKNVMIGILIGIVFSLITVIVVNRLQKPKPTPQPEVIIIEDNTKIDSLNIAIWKLNARIDSSKVTIVKSRQETSRMKKELAVYRSYKDSLEMAYKELKTLERCDSLVQAQNAVIIEQDTILMALESEAIEYSNQVALLDKKVVTQDTIIVEQRNTIDELKCAYAWKIRKPFLAWLLGWKCNNPPGKR